MSKIRKITQGRAKIHEFNDSGEILKVIKVDIRLCIGENPQGFSISMPDKSKTRHIEIVFSRKLIESMINTNWWNGK